MKFGDKERDLFLRKLKSRENFHGRIKFQARFGKTVFRSLGDEKNQPFPARELIKHIENNPKIYRSSFCTGYVHVMFFILFLFCFVFNHSYFAELLLTAC